MRRGRRSRRRASEPAVAERTDEFFVGYGATVPPGTARIARRAIVLLLLLAVATPLLLVLARTPLAPATFEYGVTRRFRGTLHAAPVPTLVVARQGADGGDAGGDTATTSLLLVAPGKHGAQSLLQPHDGARVELSGSLVYRGGHAMIEVEPGSIVTLASPQAAATAGAVTDLGPVRLRGEIVDTKCHLGVMNPGDGKTHRGCAARCINGGIPPALRVRDAAGREALYLLVGPQGEPIGRELLALVAEPVEVAGRAERRDDLLVLYAAPSAVRRLGEEG